jgi:hypothetical protein
MIDHGVWPWLTLPLTIVFTLSWMASAGYFLGSAWRDAGSIPPDLQPPTALLEKYGCKTEKCDDCGGRWQPPRANHCADCGRCLFKQQWHSLATGNCVGVKTLRSYLVWLAACSVMTATSSALGFIVVADMAGYRNEIVFRFVGGSRLEQQIIVALAVNQVVCLVALVYLLDTWDSLLQGIDRNQTYLESLKDLYGVKVDSELT